MSPLIDAHTHLDACGAHDAATVAEIVDRAEAVGVGRVVTVADDLDAARFAVDAANWDSRVYAAVAIHPTRANVLDVDTRAEVERLASDPRVVAVHLLVGGAAYACPVPTLDDLRRTAVGPFGLDVARTLDQLADDFAVLPIAEAARSAFPSLDLDEAGAGEVRVGRALGVELAGLTALFAPDGAFLALYEPRGGSARPVAVFV